MSNTQKGRMKKLKYIFSIITKWEKELKCTPFAYATVTCWPNELKCSNTFI